MVSKRTLKAIQILGCSSGLVIRHWKPRCSPVLPSISISSKPLSSFSPHSYLQLVYTMDSSFLPKFSTAITRFRAFYASLALPDTNSDGNSSSPFSSSSPSFAIQSAGNVPNISFCQWCGGPTMHDIPDGDVIRISHAHAESRGAWKRNTRRMESLKFRGDPVKS